MALTKTDGRKALKDVYDCLRWLYAATASWRVDSTKQYIKICYTVFKLVTYISYLFHVTTIILGAILYCDNLQMLFFCLTYLIICLVGITKIFLLEFHINNLKKLENRLDNDLYLPWVGKGKVETKVKKKNADIVTLCAKLIYTTSAIGVTVTIFSPAFPNSHRVFIIPTPFDHLLKTRLFLPIYLYQEFSLITFITAFTSYDLVFVGLLVRLCDQLEIIVMNLKEIELSLPDDGIRKECDFESPNLLKNDRKCAYLPDDDNWKQQEWQLRERHAMLIKNCIAHHQAVFREVKVVGRIYSYTTFTYIFCGPFLMGLLAYIVLSQLTGSGLVYATLYFTGTAAINISIQQAFYAVPAGIFLFMQCYFGSQLTLKFEDVRFAFYDCPWYNMDVKTRKLIVTALITMEKNGKLRAGKMVDVSLKTFLWSVKVSYNIVTFLKNTS